MGMTDKQFSTFIRLLLNDVKKAKEEKDAAEKDKLLNEILETLQKALED